MTKLDNQVALVTGAGSGIGEAIAIGFANIGAKVVCADKNLEGAENTANTILANSGSALEIKADVSSPSDCKNQVKATVEKFGSIDILVNNAGVGFHRLFVDSGRLESCYWG